MRNIILSLFINILVSCSGNSNKVQTQKIETKSYLNKKTEVLPNSCPRLEDRETRDYTFSWNPYLKMQEGYRISKLGSSYDVYLKIVTKSPEPNKQNIFEYKKLPSILMKKWRGCFDKVNESITHDGSKIRLHLVDYSQQRDMPYAVIVNQKSDVEVNDQLWLFRQSCSDLIKISFHLLGLVDEKPSDDFSCRPSTLSDSVMNDAEEALYNIKRSGYEYVTYRCECDSYNTRNCGRLLSRGYQKWGQDGNLTCPQGTYLIKKYVLKKDMWDWAQKHKAQILNYYKRPFGSLGMDLLCQAYGAMAGRYSHCSKASMESLVEPAHFRAILNPGCLKKNRKYVSCVKNSYENKNCTYSRSQAPGCFDKQASWLQ